MKLASRLTMAVAVAAALTGLISSSAFAQTPTPATPSAADKKAQWDQAHPRRAEVNARLANQNKRITDEVKAGEITKTQAHSLRANDKAVRAQERSMAAQTGGHITKTEQAALNQELNKNSAAIGK